MFVWGARVRPEARRQGHAQRLLQAVEQHARETGGIVALLSTTIAANTAMTDVLFPRLGWQRLCRLDLWPSWALAVQLHGLLGGGGAPAGSTMLSLLPAAKSAASCQAAAELVPRWQRCSDARQLRGLLLRLRQQRAAAEASMAGDPCAASQPEVFLDWLPGEYAG